MFDIEAESTTLSDVVLIYIEEIFKTITNEKE